MTAFPAELSLELDRLAALPKTPSGVIVGLAREHGVSENSLRVLIPRRRHGRFGRRDRDPTLAAMTPEQIADYRILTYHGYRRADALAAMGVSQA
jgi:transposase-like protein